ncbi:putative serine esterase-domain-containing protein [Lipomyces arxii]|uniref:putative serine esterase-domain-containing protein n=1 Tax=Lipomyces arxii TaxID=56418 RepID=UPI0034CE173E
MSEDHLFVLLHGFWGNPSHLHKVRDLLLKKYPKVQILIPSSYSGNLTYDGVAVCGNRVVDEIKSSIKTLQKSDGIEIKWFSIVGYSLGGLIARYVVGELFNSGFFDTVTPMNFATFATPHLGVCAGQNTVMRKVLNGYGRRLLSQSGRDMFLGKDGIVPELADPSGYYYAALAQFQRLSVYANICHDRSVPFFTAFITDQDPFTHLSVCKPHYLSKYSPNIVDLSVPMKMLVVPVKRPWSRRDYILVTVLCTVGPILILGAIATVTVSAQLSELRLTGIIKTDPVSGRKLTMDSSVATSKRKDHHELEASLVQAAVEDVMDMTEDSQESYISTNKDETNDSSTSVSSRVSDGDYQKETVNNLNKLCDAIAAYKVSNPDFKGPSVESLDIESVQKRMARDLNALPWNKYAVHIHTTTHSHAAIVNRSNKIPEGDVIIKHWVEQVVI